MPLSDGQGKLVRRVKHRNDKQGQNISTGILAVTDAAVIGKQCTATLMVTHLQINPMKELENTGVPVKAATSYGYFNYSYRWLVWPGSALCGY